MTDPAPRYEARALEHTDGLGLPDYAVIDRRHGLIVDTWWGYFAPHDAQAAARRLNGEPEEGHERPGTDTRPGGAGPQGHS